MSERQFPVIQDPHDTKILKDPLRSIPWGLIAPHERQALINHCGQDLKTLASRGGCGLVEIYYILHDKKFPWLSGDVISSQAALIYINEQVRLFNAAKAVAL